MDKKTTDIVAYIGIIGTVISLCAGTKEESKFHINQALVIGIASIISVAVAQIPFIGFIGSIGSLLCFIAYIVGLVYAAQGEEKKIPGFGDITILK